MDENKKKGLVIAAVIVALILAGFSASRFMKGEQPEVVRKGGPPPAGQKWGKAAMMERDNAPVTAGQPTGAKAAGAADSQGPGN